MRKLGKNRLSFVFILGTKMEEQPRCKECLIKFLDNCEDCWDNEIDTGNLVSFHHSICSLCGKATETYLSGGTKSIMVPFHQRINELGENK